MDEHKELSNPSASCHLPGGGTGNESAPAGMDGAEPPAAEPPYAAAAGPEAGGPSLAAPAGPSAPEPAGPSAPAPARRRWLWWGVALVALGAVLGVTLGVGFAALGVGGDLLRPRGAWHLPATVDTIRPVSLAGAGTVDVADLYERVAPGVVRIVNGSSNGTGFFIDGRGYILTNYHVVEQARTVGVELDDGTILDGKVLGTDPSLDLAVVQIDPAGRNLTVLPLGDSDRVRPGEPVIAIGYPFGEGKSVTAGIVSGLNRQRSAPNSRALTGLIQHDAAINPGNSGGPLINARGEVIGINSQIGPVQFFVGIGFAVPSNAAKRVLDDLVAGKDVQHAWLGIDAQTLTPALAAQLGLKVTHGVLVRDVVPDGPAAAAGLKPTTRTYSGRDVPGDVITAIDGTPVRTVGDLVAYLDTRRAGDEVTLTVVREGREVRVQVKLGAMPATRGQSQERESPGPRRLPQMPELPWPFRQQ